MKPYTLLALFLALPMLARATTTATPRCSAQAQGVSPAVVELFTSEGCDSCPPADRWLASLSSEQVLALAFHVTYWDSLGWPDPYAQKAFDGRHNDAAFAGGGRTVYTPQVFLNGREWRDWRASGSAAAMRPGTPARATLALDWQADAGGVEVSLRGHLASDGGGLLHLALAENGLSSAVTRGENRGKRLRHEHVVRVLAGPWTIGAGSDYALATHIAIPAMVDSRQAQIAAWITPADAPGTLAAVSAPLACEAGRP